MSSDSSLERLRGEIDRIDAGLHDLLMRRAEIVLAIRDAKGADGDGLRPGREAQILRQLLARHGGPLPKPAVVRIWREIFAASVRLQGPFSVAVHEAHGCGFGDLARDHFGSQAPMTAFGSAGPVIDAVRRGDATVGVLPAPRPGDADPWWPRLVGDDASSPRIVARLPFAGRSNGRGGDAEALVVGRLAPEPTGRDRSYLAVDAETEIRPNRFESALRAAGLVPRLTAAWSTRDTRGIWIYLAEVEGFVEAGDNRVEGFVEQVGSPIKRLVHLGAYALPFAAAELAADVRRPVPKAAKPEAPRPAPAKPKRPKAAKPKRPKAASPRKPAAKRRAGRRPRRR